MIQDTIDNAIRWFFTFPHWTEYLVAGWIVYGLTIFFRDTTPANWKGALLTCLFTWPAALGLQILVGLHTAAVYVFDPDKGPLSVLLNTFKRAITARIHALERKPQVPAVPPPAPSGGKSA